MKVWDLVNDIRWGKKWILDDEHMGVYDPYIINRALSHHGDCIFIANEVNTIFWFQCPIFFILI